MKSNPNKWKCKVCNEIFSTRVKLIEHRKETNHRLGGCQGGCSSWNKGKSSWNKGLTKIDPRVNKYCITTEERKKLWTEEKRKLQSERKKKLYLEHPEKHPNRKLAGNRNKMSYPEKIAFDWLSKNNFKFIHQYQIEKRFVDFFLPDINLIIEIDGEHWHNEETDKIKDLKAKENGFETLRIPAKNNIEKTLTDFFDRTNVE